MTSDQTIPVNTGPDTPFVTTRWTRVLEASGDSPEAQTALSELCGAYYAPVVAFLHRRDATRTRRANWPMSFSPSLLARDALAGAIERERGRFRSYLLGALKHFLAIASSERASRQKRGGGVVARAVR